MLRIIAKICSWILLVVWWQGIFRNLLDKEEEREKKYKFTSLYILLAAIEIMNITLKFDLELSMILIKTMLVCAAVDVMCCIGEKTKKFKKNRYNEKYIRSLVVINLFVLIWFLIECVMIIF